MKKITLLVLVFFAGAVVAIYGLGIIFANQNSISATNTLSDPTNINNKTQPNNNSTSSQPAISSNNSNKPVSKTKINQPTTPPKSQPALNATEISKHSSANDCYLIVKNKVYNVSSYIGSHPGGRNKITSNCGTEVTGIFAQIHSNFAWNLLNKYYIGDVIK
ncbi:MAG: cytochrome b5 domain-containing protein [Candidatus Buchananbacteria bacterium]